MKRLSTLIFVAALLSVGTAEATTTGDACERFLSRVSSSSAANAAVPNEEIGAASARVAAACNDAKEEEEETVCGALRDQKVLAQILAALSAGHTTPRLACRLLLGDDDHHQTQLLRSSKRAETAKCEVCKLVVKGAEAVLTDETTDKEIERELERLCRVFGAQEDVCDEFVEYGIVELVAMLRGKFTPDVVCSKVHLCN